MAAVRFLISVLVALGAAAPSAGAATEPLIRIGVWDESRLPAEVDVRGQLKVNGGSKTISASRLSVVARSGKLIAQPGALEADFLRITGSGLILVEGQGQQSIRTRGELRLFAAGGGIRAVVVTSLEDYTARVVAREMPLDWPEQALAAQAVVARSYGAASMLRHAERGYNVCALTHCQLWSPQPPDSRAVEAAGRTRDVVLVRNGRPVQAPYTSTCGGKTADGGAIGMSPSCTPVADGPAGRAFCRESPHFSWQTQLSTEELRRVFDIGEDRLGAAGLRISHRDAGGRAVKLQAFGRTLGAGDFLMRSGRTLGWARVKSCLFSVQLTSGGVLLTGHGLGHGAGMCQWGARGRALEGWSWERILHYYFQNSSIGRIR